MSVKLIAPQGRDHDVARSVHTALDTARQLDVAAGMGPSESRSQFSGTRLYAYATDPDVIDDPELAAALNRDSELATDFQQLLRRTALVRFPQVAAASSGAVSGRNAEGYQISFEPSRAEPTQTYVIIEVAADRDVAPKCLFLCREGRQTQKIALPPGRNGVIQVLLDNDDDVLVALRQPHSEVYLG